MLTLVSYLRTSSVGYTSQGEYWSGGKSRGPAATKLKRGSVIGFGFNRVAKNLFITVDGEIIRTEANFSPEARKNGAETKNKAENEGLYPCVGLHHSSQRVRINFGASPFKFNIQEKRDAVAKTRLAQIDEMAPPPHARLIYNYLLFHGYKNSAEALAASNPEGLYPLTERDTLMLSTLEERSQIKEWFEDGQFGDVKEHLIARYGTEAASSEASFLLDCLMFIDMVRRGDTADALEFTQTVFLQWWCEATHDRIEDCCTLLAYYDPKASPVAHLLSRHHRDMTFKFINRCILMWSEAIPLVCDEPIQQEPDLNQMIAHLNSTQAHIRNKRKGGTPFELSHLFREPSPS